MRRSAWIFLAAILLPSFALAWLAIQSARDQQVVLEHQQAIISQNVTDALAKNIQAQMDQIRSDFAKTTRQMLDASSSPRSLAVNFSHDLPATWPLAEIGFAVDLHGEIYSPNPGDGPAAQLFRDENDRFLSNRENVEIYASNSVVANQAGPAAPGVTLAFSQNQLTLNPNPPNFRSAIQAPAAASPEKPVLLGQMTTMDRTATQGTEVSDLSAAISRLKNVTNSPDQGGALREKAPRAEPVLSNRVILSDGSTTTVHGVESGGAMLDQPTSASAPGPAASSPPTDSRLKSGKEASAAAAPLPATAPIAAPVAEDSSASSATEEAKANLVPISNAASSAPSASLMNGSFQAFARLQRQVIPQQMLARDSAPISNTVPEESDFRRIVGTQTSGALARFLEDKLRLMVWTRVSPDASIVFGAQLDESKVVDALKSSFQIPELQTAYAPAGFGERTGAQFYVALLNESGHPVALSQPGFQADWKHPFVATELGDALPHWEAALYLVDPGQIGRSARTLQYTLGLIVLLLMAAIVSGGSLIAADVRRQVRLAQQKTDFVSNVSHELKTPLTSIRMFADLLAEKRVPDGEKQETYLRIISAEAARLTRLINNVLDFARLERGVPTGGQGPCDLVEAARDVVATCGPHLEAAGLDFQCGIEAEALPLTGDRDALAQIILNLVSNAEKYGGGEVLVRVRRQATATGALGCVDVLDRGPGIPAKAAARVFEPFQRLDDSLAAGVPGSGLGLTLARRMARAHGGDVTYSPRAGGGSCFTLAVPLRQ